MTGRMSASGVEVEGERRPHERRVRLRRSASAGAAPEPRGLSRIPALGTRPTRRAAPLARHV
eukprot:15471938-Alexandrium_andersonii.AAC.1